MIWIDWNDVAAFERVIAENPGDIAGFMAAPYWMPLSGDDVLPADGSSGGDSEHLRPRGDRVDRR